MAANSELNEKSLTLNLTLTLNLVSPSIVFDIFLSWFLRLYHFYGLFKAYFYMRRKCQLDYMMNPDWGFLTVRPRYLTCAVREIYWPLILKFRCFIIFLLDLSVNIKISEYQNSRIIVDIGIFHTFQYIWLQNDSLLVIIDHCFATHKFKICKHRIHRTLLEKWVGGVTG